MVETPRNRPPGFDTITIPGCISLKLGCFRAIAWNPFARSALRSATANRAAVYLLLREVPNAGFTRSVVVCVHCDACGAYPRHWITGSCGYFRNLGSAAESLHK